MTTRLPSRSVVHGVARLLRSALAVLLPLTLPQAVAAQSTDWFVSLTVTPNPSAFIADWERNPSTALLNITYTGRTGADVRVEAYARTARGEVGRVRSPLMAFAGGPATQVFTSLEVADWDEVSSNRAIIDVVRRTGVLPEGRYEVCARVVTPQGQQLAEGCNQFDVALPEPPQLLFPNNGGAVNARMPVFQWGGIPSMPGTGIRYRVRIAERLEGQQPDVALAASQPHFEGEAAVPLLVYPVDGLPLRAGREYAWQVEAIDDEGRSVTRGGKKSEIWTFRASDIVGGATAELPDVMELVPGAVRLGGFRAARVQENEFTYTVNGPLRVELLAPFPGLVDVEASNLVIDRGALPDLRVLSGSLKGKLPKDLVPGSFAGEYVTLTDLAYDTRDGITLGAQFQLPGGTAKAFPQRARLGAVGLFGTLSITEQLLLAGTSPVRLNVNRVTVRYPYATVDLEGGLELFGRDAKCTLSFGKAGESGVVPITPRCLNVTEIPLAGGDNGLKLVVRNLAGTLALDPVKKQVVHALAGAATVAVSAGANCGASFSLGIENGAVTLGDSTTRCESKDGTLKMGWLSGKTSSLAVQRFAWDSTRKQFDFALTMDVQPKVERAASFPLPAFVGVRLGADGVRFPAVDTTVVVSQPVGFLLYDVTPARVRIAEALIPWNAWQVKKSGDEGEGAGIGDRMSYEFTGTLALDPWIPGVKIPACITGQQVEITRGRLSAAESRFTLRETSYDAGCELRVSPSNSFSFEITRVAGEVVQLARGTDDAKDASEARSNQDADIYGAFILPEAFSCARTGQPHKLPITRPLRFSRNGINGVISGFAPRCPIDLALLTLQPGEGTLTLAVRDSQQTAVLDVSVGATFALSATPVKGKGTLTVDLVAGKVTKSDIDFPGPFRLDLPREQPVLSFEIAAARLDTAGLFIDGRNRLTLGSGQVIQTTFDRVRLNPATASISSGRVLFDVPFALEASVSDSAPPRWGAVPAGSPVKFATGVRVDLPSQIALDSSGFSVRGEARGRVRFGDRDLDSLALAFRDDLKLSLAPFAVRAGSIDFNLGELRVAMIDRLGFHPDFGYFAQRLIPARLPLPDTTVAYAQLRDADGRLLVTADTTPQGVRLRTRPGAMITLGFPALALGRPTEPRVDAALDVTIDRATGAVIAGAVHARIPEGDRSTFDLLEAGLPVAFDTVAYEKRDGAPFQFYLGGRLRLLGGSQAQPGTVQLALGGDGRLAGAVRVVTRNDSTVAPLHTDKLRYAIDSITGRFDANVRSGSLKYDLTLGGAIGLVLGPGRTYSVPATIRATQHAIEVTEIRPATDDTTNHIDLESFRLRLQNLRVPRLAYSHVTRHLDFEMLFDVAFEFPQLDSLDLPVLRDVALREDGFTFPKYTVPDLTAASVEVDGFLIRPLAFRMPKVQYDWFRNQVVGDWGFRFDLEVSFREWPDGAPEFIRNAKLSILDAGISNGYLVGRIESREVDEAIRVGQEVSVRVKQLWGTLTDPTVYDSIGNAIRDSAESAVRQTLASLKKSKLDLYVEGEFSLGKHGQCEGAAKPESFQVATASLRIRGNAGLTGRLSNFVPRCPIVMGDVVVTPGNSTLGIGVPFDSTGVRLGDTQAWLRTEASVSLPGPQEGSRVSARGMLALELTEPRILDGYVSLTEPFQVALPREKPLFTFIARDGRLDARGLRVSGEGQLALDEGRSIGVSFKDLTLNPRTFRVTGGSASFLGKFALASNVSEDGKVEWRATDSTAAVATGSGFRITLPDTITLSPAGLSIAGTAGAALVYGDSTFASLTANFRDGFTLDLNGTGAIPVRVARGRAELIREGLLAQRPNDAPADTASRANPALQTQGDSLRALVAHVDSLGFWPGNVFGVLPIPAKLGLTDTTVAYLRLRDDAGRLLVESSSTPQGIRVRTSGISSVDLVVPALAAEGEAAPSLGVMFDVVINPRTFGVVSGEIATTLSEEAEALLSLRNLGIPLDVKRISYAARGLDGYALRLDGRVALPGSLDSLDLRFTDLAITRDGLKGTVDVGTLAERWSSELAVIAGATLRAQSTDTLALQVVGARATFDGPRSQVQLAGAIRSSLFASRDSGYVPLFFSGTATTTGVTLAVDPAKGTGKPLPISVATFEPQAIGGHAPIEVTATADELTLRLGGTIRVPSLGDRFALTVAGLKIGTRGIELPQVAMRGADRQSLELFGATFTLRDSVDAGGVPVFPALSLARQEGVLSLTMSGDVLLLGNTTRFYGLRVGSDGKVALAGANLISQPLNIVDGRFVLDTLAIRDNALHASALLTLPAPFSGGEAGQRARFSVAADGKMTGGGRFTLISEQEGLRTAKTKVELPMVTAHLRYVGLTLDLGTIEASALEMVGDLYVQADEGNRIRVGSTAGGHIQPGLRFGFDGSTMLGPISVSDTLAVDFQVVRLAVANVTATGTAEDFTLGFSGKLSLTLPTVKGGVSFADVRLTSGGSVEMGNAEVQGGEFEIAEVVRLDLSGFQYSDSPTTIRMAAGGTPFGGGAASGDSITVAVTSYVRFGGTIDVKGALTGGVQEVLFFKTAEGETQMAVRKAVMNIYGVVDLTGDFLYREKGSDFEMLLGAQGKIMDGPGLTFVGLVAQEQATTRIGVFAAASGLTIPITPFLTVTDLGAGFFLNPKPEYIDYVRQFTGLGGNTQGKVRAGPKDRFAIMLYGGAQVTPGIAKGRMLITVSPTVLMLDGDVTVLDQGNRFRGEAHLAVGLKRPFAEGNIKLDVEYDPVISGSGSLEFFVYENAWGIRGKTELELVKLIQGNGTLFIGSPGFLIAASIKVPSLGIVSIKRAEAMAFYIAQGSEWGALAAIGAELHVIPGVLSVGGTLEGALIRPANSSPYIYAVAEVEVSALIASFSGSVWAKFGPGGADAGLGRDRQMEAVIARATGMGQQMEEAKAEAEVAVAEARASVGPELPIALSQAELVAAYNRIQGWTPDKFEIARTLSVDAIERNTYPQANEKAYFDWYVGVLKQDGAPGDTAIVRQYRDTVATYVNAITGRKPAVDARLRDLRTRVGALTTTAVGLAPAMPGIDTSFVLETREEIRGDDTVKVAVAAPTFAVDGAALAAQRTALQEHDAAVQRFDAEVRQRLQEMEQGLTSVRRVTTANDEGSLLSYARLHGAVRSAAERQYALHANQILRKQGWMQARRAELARRQPEIEAILNGKTAAMVSAYNYCRPDLVQVGNPNNSPDGRGDKREDLEHNREEQERAAACRQENSYKDFARNRATALHAWVGGPILTTFDAAAAGRRISDPWFATQGETYGRDLWYNLAAAGMDAAIGGADAELALLEDKKATQLAGLRDAHGALSSSLARLYADQAELAGLLFEAYDRYIYGRTGTGNPTTPELARYAQRREQLRAELAVPRMGDVRVVQSHDGYMTTTAFSWSAWHGEGVFEYAFRDDAGGDNALGDVLYSVGDNTGFTSYHAGRPTSNVARTLQVGARGGAGYAGYGRARYELRSSAPGAVPQTTASRLSIDETAPTTPVIELVDLEPTIGADGTQTVWLTGARPVTVRFSAVDPESGIGGYEYAIGTSAGAADIRGWQSVGGREQAVIHDLRPGAGVRAFVSVRAFNGAGKYGAVGTSAALRIDESAPVFGAPGSVILAGAPAGAAPEFVALTLPACTAEAPASTPWQGQLGNVATAAAAPVFRTSLPVAQDPESGVEAYYYIVDTIARTSFDGAGWTQAQGTTLEVTGAPLTFGREYVVSVVAMNKSGRASTPYVIGPFVPADPSAPSAFAACAGIATAADRIAISMLAPAHDPETGITGYEYRVREGSRILRDWPTAGPDFGKLSAGATVTTEALPMRPGQQYQVDIRAVNGQGQRSGIVRAGPLSAQFGAPTTTTDVQSY